MAEQIDLYIDKKDMNELTDTVELQLLAELSKIKSLPGTIERPADPQLAKTQRAVRQQVAAERKTTERHPVVINRTIDWDSQVITNYLLAFIAFLLFIGFVIQA